MTHEGGTIPDHCVAHQGVCVRIGGLESRMDRLEKFVIGALIFFTLSSFSALYLIIELPNRLVAAEHGLRNSNPTQYQSHQ